MRVILLNEVKKEVKNLFMDFVPTNYESYLEEGQAFVLGAAEDSGKKWEAAGIAIASVEGDENGVEFVIKWLWVDPEYRNRDAAGMMMDMIFRAARLSGFHYVTVHIPAFGSVKSLDPELEEYFANIEFYNPVIRVVDGMRVFELTARTDSYLSIINTMANEEARQQMIEERYNNFPTKYKEIGIEYYSGVPV